MYSITFRYQDDQFPELKLSRLAPGQSLLEVCIDHHLELKHECGGMSTCGTCNLKIRKGESHVEFQSKREIHALMKKGVEPATSRLACQCVLLPGKGELIIELPVKNNLQQ